MKKITQTSLNAIAFTLVSLFFMFLFPVNVFAKPYVPTKMTFQAADEYQTYLADNFSFPKGYTISKVKTTNCKVAKLVLSKEGKRTECNIYIRHTGTATISFKAKKGKTSYTYKCKVTVTRLKTYDTLDVACLYAKAVLSGNKITLTGTFYDEFENKYHFNKKNFAVASGCYVAFDYPVTLYKYSSFRKKHKSITVTEDNGNMLDVSIKNNKVIKIKYCGIGN